MLGAGASPYSFALPPSFTFAGLAALLEKKKRGRWKGRRSGTLSISARFIGLSAMTIPGFFSFFRFVAVRGRRTSHLWLALGDLGASVSRRGWVAGTLSHGHRQLFRLLLRKVEGRCGSGRIGRNRWNDKGPLQVRVLYCLEDFIVWSFKLGQDQHAIRTSFL